MATSIFDVKAQMPNDNNITEALGSAKELWDKLEAHIFKNYQDTKTEWKFYSKKAGWSYIIKSGKRTLLYLIPQDGYFKITFVFGEKAVTEAKKANLPESILHSIEEAMPYVEGRSFMIEVRGKEDIEISKILLMIKESN